MHASRKLWRVALPIWITWLVSWRTGKASAQESVVLSNGNVKLAAMLEVNEQEGSDCGAYDAYSLQELVAVTWFLDAVDAMDYVPGVRLGLDVYRTCNLPEKAAGAAVEILNRYKDQQNVSLTPSVLFGMLGPGRTSEAGAVSALIGYLPTNQRILQISGAATGTLLNDRESHSNFFRVIPPDRIQVEVILKLLLDLQWNYVAIVYDNDHYGRNAAEELRLLAQAEKICIPVFNSLPLDARSSEFATAANNIAGRLNDPDSGLVRGMVILGGTATTQQLVQILNRKVTFTQLILSEGVGLNKAILTSSSAGTVISLAKGALTTSPLYVDIPEFSAFWSRLWTNETLFNRWGKRLVWLSEFFTQISGCGGGGTGVQGCWDQVQGLRQGLVDQGGQLSVYVFYQIKAVAVFIELMKRLHSQKCNGQVGACQAFLESVAKRTELVDFLQQNSFSLAAFTAVSTAFKGLGLISFDPSTGEVILHGNDDMEYAVYNFRATSASTDFSFEKIGSFKNHFLAINMSATEFYDEMDQPVSWKDLPYAQCQDNHDCIQCEHDVSSGVIFMEGDFYIIGLVPVSAKNPYNLLKCGEVKGVVGADLAQAIIFAVNQINQKFGQFRTVLPSRKIGLVVINTCGNPMYVRQQLMDFYTGKFLLPDGQKSDTMLGNVMGVVGAFYSANSIASSETLTQLGQTFVQVSPGSTSPDLKDRFKHPYFMRLVPADDTQARVMIDIIRSLGANYIQVMYDSSTAYATAMYNKLKEEMDNPTIASYLQRLCIAQSIPLTPKVEVSQYRYLVDVLRVKSAARIVIVIMHAVEVNKVMDAILPLLSASENFLFLGSEAWGRRQEIIQGKTRLLGSLVLAQEIATDKVFEQYFSTVETSSSTSNSTVNPWLNSFWEARLNCFLNKSFKRRGKTGKCPKHFAESYKQDALVPFYIQSTYALAKGFSAALAQYCGSQAHTRCEALTSEKLVSKMQKVELDLYSTAQYSSVFDSNGDGLVGYKILQVSMSPSGQDVIYKDVGSWTWEGLSLKRDELLLPGEAAFSSSCPNSLECGKCFDRFTSNPSSQKRTAGDAGIGVGTFVGVIVVLCVIIIVLVIFVFWCRRKAANQQQDRHLNNHHSPYEHQRPQFPMEFSLPRSDTSFSSQQPSRNTTVEETDLYSMPDETCGSVGPGSSVDTLPIPTRCHKESSADGDYLTAVSPDFMLHGGNSIQHT